MFVLWLCSKEKTKKFMRYKKVKKQRYRPRFLPPCRPSYRRWLCQCLSILANLPANSERQLSWWPECLTFDCCCSSIRRCRATIRKSWCSRISCKSAKTKSPVILINYQLVHLKTLNFKISYE